MLKWLFGQLQVFSLELELLQPQNAIFPGVMLAMGSPALVGAIIGAIAPIASLFAFLRVITPIAEKVNEYIISPVIECFSSKKEEDGSSLPCRD
jgi:hypothetical protein